MTDRKALQVLIIKELLRMVKLMLPYVIKNKATFDANFNESDHPRDTGGKFSKTEGGKGKNDTEIQKKINSIKIDFLKDNILPNLNKETLAELGKTDKPVLLKKLVIDKNKASHPDIKEAMYKEILGNSLYRPEVILPANKEKPAYFNFITRVGEDKSSIVLLEIADNKENYEIVNLHYIDDKSRDRKWKK